MPYNKQIQALLAQSDYLRVKVAPNRNQNEIRAILEDNTVKINIKAAPEKNKANKELIKFLAEYLSIPLANVHIISGQHDQLKLLRIELEKIS